MNYAGVSGMPDMPILALDFKMKKQLNSFSYYGMGPDENYIDRNMGARLGVWESRHNKRSLRKKAILRYLCN